MASPFEVAPVNLSGLGMIANAYGQKSQQDQMKEDQMMQMEQQKAGASNAMKLLNQANMAQDPAERERLFMEAYQASPDFTNGLISNMKRRAEVDKLNAPIPQQQGTGNMSGYSYDPSSGTFSINPEVSQQLKKKAEDKAAKGLLLGAKDRQGINKDVTGLIKGTAEIAKSAKSLAGLKESSSPAAQLAAVFSFMKAMDPSSTVRESEQGQVYNAQGAAKGIANKINALIGKGGLSEEGFQDLVNTANNLANTAIDSSSVEVEKYLDSYEDTLPDSFKERIINRLPSRLDIITGDYGNDSEYKGKANSYTSQSGITFTVE